jgi:hypothetical protein
MTIYVHVCFACSAEGDGSAGRVHVMMMVVDGPNGGGKRGVVRREAGFMKR